MALEEHPNQLVLHNTYDYARNVAALVFIFGGMGAFSIGVGFVKIRENGVFAIAGGILFILASFLGAASLTRTRAVLDRAAGQLTVSRFSLLKGYREERHPFSITHVRMRQTVDNPYRRTEAIFVEYSNDLELALDNGASVHLIRVVPDRASAEKVAAFMGLKLEFDSPPPAI